MCKHETPWLLGTADGITCRECGAVFHDMAELTGAQDPAEKPEAEAQDPEEKPKRGRRKKEE